MTTRLHAIIVALAVLLSATSLSLNAEQKTVHVQGYTRKDGTRVKPHDRKAPEKKSASAAATTETSRKTSSKTASGVAGDERGRTQRSAAARHAFARQSGYPNGRPGYIIDHIVPLVCGGADGPTNMQWQTVAEAKAKDKLDRRGCR